MPCKSTLRWRKWKVEDPAKYRAHLDKTSAGARRRRAEDPTKERAYHKAWRDRNKALWGSYYKRWERDGKNPKEVKIRIHFRNRYGITLEEYRDMHARQYGCCQICGTLGKDPLEGDRKDVLCVDHDHVTGNIRALLCQKCNRGIGQFSDDIRMLMNAIVYLGKHKRDGIREVS